MVAQAIKSLRFQVLYESLRYA